MYSIIYGSYFRRTRVDALGVNCSLGPNELGDVVDEIIKYSSIPIMVQPNAGLPTIKEGGELFIILSLKNLQIFKGVL